MKISPLYKDPHSIGDSENNSCFFICMHVILLCCYSSFITIPSTYLNNPWADLYRQIKAHWASVSFSGLHFIGCTFTIDEEIGTPAFHKNTDTSPPIQSPLGTQYINYSSISKCTWMHRYACCNRILMQTRPNIY